MKIGRLVLQPTNLLNADMVMVNKIRTTDKPWEQFQVEFAGGGIMAYTYSSVIIHYTPPKPNVKPRESCFTRSYGGNATFDGYYPPWHSSTSQQTTTAGVYKCINATSLIVDGEKII